MGKPAARVGDMHACPLFNPGSPPPPHVGGPVANGNNQVLIGGQPVATVGSTCICQGPADQAVRGSASVFVGGMSLVRAGDLTAHGGTIMAGCSTVLVGDEGPYGVPTVASVSLLKASSEREAGVVLDPADDHLVSSLAEYEAIEAWGYRLDLAAEEEETAEPCSLHEVEIRRDGDPGAKISLRLEESGADGGPSTLPGDTPSVGMRVLQAVGGPRHKPAKIAYAVRFGEGPCGAHDGRAVACWPATAGGSQPTGNEGTLELTGPEFPEGERPPLWPYHVPPRRYELRAAACEGATAAVVEVFPDLEWTINLSLNFKPGKQDIGPPVEGPAKGSVKGEITWKQDGREPSAEFDWFTKSCEFLHEIMEGVAGAEAELKKIGERAAARRQKLDVALSLDLEASWGWKDRQGEAVVEYPFSLKLGGTLEVEVAVDVVELVLKYSRLSPQGLALWLVKNVLRKGIDTKERKFRADVGFELRAKGELGAGGSHAWVRSNHLVPQEVAEPRELRDSCFLEGSIRGEVVGFVTGRLKAWHFVDAEVEGEAGEDVELVKGKLGIGVDTGRGPFVIGTLRFLKIYLVAVGHASLQGEVTSTKWIVTRFLREKVFGLHPRKGKAGLEVKRKWKSEIFGGFSVIEKDHRYYLASGSG